MKGRGISFGPRLAGWSVFLRKRGRFDRLAEPGGSCVRGLAPAVKTGYYRCRDNQRANEEQTRKSKQTRSHVHVLFTLGLTRQMFSLLLAQAMSVLVHGEAPQTEESLLLQNFDD